MLVGAASGMMMASVFVSLGMVMLFVIVKDPPPGFRPLMEKVPPSTMAMSVVVVAYPTWSVVGAVLGLLFEISVEQAPGGGIGSPNLAFTLAVVVVAVMMAAPFVVLLRRVAGGVLALTLAFIGLFGWLLPHLAT